MKSIAIVTLTLVALFTPSFAISGAVGYTNPEDKTAG